MDTKSLGGRLRRVRAAIGANTMGGRLRRVRAAIGANRRVGHGGSDLQRGECSRSSRRTDRSISRLYGNWSRILTRDGVRLIVGRLSVQRLVQAGNLDILRNS